MALEDFLSISHVFLKSPDDLSLVLHHLYLLSWSDLTVLLCCQTETFLPLPVFHSLTRLLLVSIVHIKKGPFWEQRQCSPSGFGCRSSPAAGFTVGSSGLLVTLEEHSVRGWRSWRWHGLEGKGVTHEALTMFVALSCCCSSSERGPEFPAQVWNGRCSLRAWFFLAYFTYVKRMC